MSGELEDSLELGSYNPQLEIGMQVERQLKRDMKGQENMQVQLLKMDILELLLLMDIDKLVLLGSMLVDMLV